MKSDSQNRLQVVSPLLRLQKCVIYNDVYTCMAATATSLVVTVDLLLTEFCFGGKQKID